MVKHPTVAINLSCWLPLDSLTLNLGGQTSPHPHNLCHASRLSYE